MSMQGKHRPALALALFALAACAAGCAFASVPAQAGDDAPQFIVDRWTTAAGLPVNAIRHVHRSPSGYLWLTTYDGLVRFDGQRFTVFSSPELGKRLGDLLESSDGLVWVRNEAKRLASFDGEAFHLYGVSDGLPSDIVTGVVLDAGGGIWATTETGLARREGGRFRTVFDEPALGRLAQALPMPDGSVWIAASAGLFRWDGHALRRADGGAEATRGLEAMALDDTGRLWLSGTGGMVVRQSDGGTALVAGNCGAQRIEATARHVAAVCGSIGVDVDAGGRVSETLRASRYGSSGGERLLGLAPDGSLWRNRIDRLDRDGQTVYAAPCEILDFAFDRLGGVWVATACEGLLRLRPRRIMAITELGGTHLGAVYGLAQGPDGALWIATVHHGTATLATDGSVRWLDGEHGLLPDGYYTVAVAADGDAWIGGCHLDRRAWRCTAPQDLPAAAGQGDQVRAVHHARDGSLWVAGTGLWRRTPDGEWHEAATGLARDDGSQVRAILERADGTLWFGTHGDGLLRRALDGSFRRYTTSDGLSSGIIRALREDRDGQLWIAMENTGLCRLRETSEGARIACLDQRHGLWSDSLHQIVFDAGDRAWINSNQGVFAVPRAALDGALDALAAGRQAHVHPQVFTERDGLPNREGNGGVDGAGLLLADGRIAFPTQNGVALIDPARMQPAGAGARIVVEGIDLPGDRHARVAPRVELERGERSLEVRYTGLATNLTTPLYFRYRLSPDPSWRDLGDARQLSLAHLPPGEHRLELQAIGDSRPGPPASIDLVLPPYFHETAAFRIALPLSLLLFAVVAVLRHFRLAKRRHAELEAIVATRTDDLRHALDTVNRQRDEIAGLASSRNRFFANVSHELRTPLTLISGPLRDAAAGQPLLPEAQAIMLGNACRLERLVTELLDLERLDAGSFPLRPETGDLAAVVDESVRGFLPLARQQQVALVCPAMPPLPLRFDADQIARLLGNLLSNALKFTPRDGRVAVSLDDAGGRVRVAVSDSGPGVPEDWRERIFDRFAQVGSEATRGREGAGLGLAVCREIARLHGGRLWVEAGDGGGARFVLELPNPTVFETPAGHLDASPAHEAPPVSRAMDDARDDGTGAPAAAFHVPEPAGESSAADEAPAPRRRVLVAEDHPELRAYIAGILGGDHAVLVAADGEEALAIARRELPDLVVSDVMMPRMDGFGLARALRADPGTEGIPLIFLTARASDADEIAGLSSGADQYLRKPFDGVLLRARIAAALHAVERLRRRFAAVVPPAEPAPPAGNAADRRFLEAAEHWFASHLHDESATIQGLADALHVSRATLGRRYARLAGEPPVDALRRKRLERARALLAAGEGNVSEVAYAVGYSSLAAFSNAYRERFGHAPSRG
jgi:signal transduction histidine kinase/CheY-like chemotaxis protein/ligand-binding sensor domain-containing protein/AraC-like DNA-binding protein